MLRTRALAEEQQDEWSTFNQMQATCWLNSRGYDSNNYKAWTDLSARWTQILNYVSLIFRNVSTFFVYILNFKQKISNNKQITKFCKISKNAYFYLFIHFIFAVRNWFSETFRYQYNNFHLFTIQQRKRSRRRRNEFCRRFVPWCNFGCASAWKAQAVDTFGGGWTPLSPRNWWELRVVAVSRFGSLFRVNFQINKQQYVIKWFAESNANVDSLYGVPFLFWRFKFLSADRVVGLFNSGS